MRTFDGVLFDFGHTLFDAIAPEACIAQFRAESGVDVDPVVFASEWEIIRQRARQPDELAKGRDLSAAGHRRCWLELLAPLDDLASGLAEFMYGCESTPKGWRPYPDTRGVLAELHRREIPVGVVSDCGWDIRELFTAYEVQELVGSFDLSYEHGVAKPDRRLFESACAQLGVEAARTLMVGDNWLTDGGAAAIGITTLILPARDRTAFPALASVLELRWSVTFEVQAVSSCRPHRQEARIMPDAAGSQGHPRSLFG
jgi:putative hydrolase of the HAD superfamily